MGFAAAIFCLISLQMNHKPVIGSANYVLQMGYSNLQVLQIDCNFHCVLKTGYSFAKKVLQLSLFCKYIAVVTIFANRLQLQLCFTKGYVCAQVL